MPGLIACNRRWDIGSDDLMFPALLEIWVRLLWLIAIAVVFNTHRLSFDCSHGVVIQTYYIGTLVILSCHIIMNVCIVVVSMQGNIMNHLPRKHMSKLLYFKLALFLPELLWTILGTYWAFDESSNCESFVGTAMKIASDIGWIVFMTLIIAILIVFDPLGSRRRSTEDHASEGVKLWETRCRVLCCCTACDDQHSAAFTDAAKLFADFFKDVDLVATDIAAGLLLVHQQQKIQPFKYTYQTLRSGQALPPGEMYRSNDQRNDVTESIPTLVQVDQNESLVEVEQTSNVSSQVVDAQPQAVGGATPSNHSQRHSNSSNNNQSQGAYNVNSIIDIEEEGDRYVSPQITTTGYNCDRNQSNSNRDTCDNFTSLDIAIESPGTPSGSDVCDGGWSGSVCHDNMMCIKDWMSVENAAHYMEFALGIYTWPVYMFMNLFCGSCKLCTNYQCCAGSSPMGDVIDDNCCQCHLAAVMKITGVDRQDILHANFNNKIYESPFFVALDHKMGAVVVAIRGTLSLKDALTDLSAECASCDIEGLGEQYVHKGILQTAKYVQNTLESLNLLNAAFQRAPGYNLMITGHSLGAGVAALLAILLRPKYRFLQCYAFSPPGGLLSLPLAKYTQDFVCSVVVGEDLVPRLGITTMERLKVSILKVIRDSGHPKYRILAGGCWSVMCGYNKPDDSGDRRRLVDFTAQRSYTEDQDGVAYDPQTRPKTVQESVNEAIHESDRTCSLAKHLFMPGVVLYLQEEEPTSGCYETPTYRADWARQVQFDEIVVTPKMLTDHLPDVVLKALKESVERGVQARCVLTSASE